MRPGVCWRDMHELAYRCILTKLKEGGILVCVGWSLSCSGRVSRVRRRGVRGGRLEGLRSFSSLFLVFFSPLFALWTGETWMR